MNELKWRALIFALMLVVSGLLPAMSAKADPVTDGAKYVAGKVADTDWLSRKALKYGFMLTVCATNTLRMAREADEFDSRDLLGTDTHHAVDIMLVTGYIASGYLLYAVLERDTWDWKDKTELISGTLCLAREFGEFTYQGMRHGDPFNNNPDWHQSELPGFAAKPTFPFLRDRMIATGRFSTPALHLGFTGVGAKLIGGVR